MVMGEIAVTRERVAILFVLILFGLFVYGVFTSLYDKYFNDYDQEKIYKICANTFAYPCEDLLYAAPYCSAARTQSDKANCSNGTR